MPKKQEGLAKSEKNPFWINWIRKSKNSVQIPNGLAKTFHLRYYMPKSGPGSGSGSGPDPDRIRTGSGTSVELIPGPRPVRRHPYCRLVLMLDPVFPDFRIRIRSGNRAFHRVVIRRPRRSRRHPNHGRGTSGSQNWPRHYSILI